MPVSDDTISRIKSLPVSSILESEGVFLRRIGREYTTHCLWHKDKNPSLTISDDKGFVFCHVCQQHNDAIGFIQQKFGIGFRDACERIAEKNNINCVFVEEDSVGYEERKKELAAAFEAVQQTQDGYRENLRSSIEAVNFIRSRNIAPEVSREFELGYDKNENRLTIPIHAHNGKLVGFTARALDNDRKPKYKNTENNAIFNKSEIVFNEYRASAAIREADECIFVEGHIDVISLWQHDLKNVVALQGTASPSDSIVKRLLNKTKRFVLCMDGDAGGKSAVEKFLATVQSLALSGQLDVRIVSLPEGSDPDSYVSEGGDLRSLINNSPSWMDWLLDSWLAGIDFSDKLTVQKIEEQIKALFSRIASPALRAHYYDKASIVLAQNKQSLAAEIAKSFHEHSVVKESTAGWTRPTKPKTRAMIEKRLVRLYIHKPDYRFVLRPLMDMLYMPSMVWLWNRISELEPLLEPNLLRDALSAVLCVSDMNYMHELRPVLSPSIKIDDNELSIAHIEDVMMEKVLPEGTIE